MSKICKIVAAGVGLWAVLRLFYGWKWVRCARAASIICHTCKRHSFACCTHSKHGSEPADKRARRFLETQDLGRENSRPARRAYVALPGAASTPCYCRLLGCMKNIWPRRAHVSAWIYGSMTDPTRNALAASSKRSTDPIFLFRYSRRASMATSIPMRLR